MLFRALRLHFLIAIWWLCNASLATLMDDKRNRAAQLLLGLFLAIGLASLLAMNRVSAIVLDRLRASAPTLYAAAVSTAVERAMGNGLGIVVGGLIFVAANKLQAGFLSMKEEIG